MDEYIKLNGERQDLGTFTGKPIELGGSLGRNEATGFGVIIATKFMAKKLGINLKDAKIGLQGFGNIGSFTLKYLEEEGAKVQYISIRDEEEKSGRSALYKKDGFSYQSLQDYRDKHKTLKGYPNAQKIIDEEFWKNQFDILIPAAIENVITQKLAKNLNTKVLVEAANGPTTPEAIEIIEDKNIEIIPDILANSGGVLVSYYEWTQNQNGYYWEKDQIQKRQEKDMLKAIEEIYEIKEKYKINLRQAAYVKAIGKIAKVMELRGWL